MRRAARLDGWIGNAYQPEEALTHLDRLNRFRRAEGTAGKAGYEVVLALLSGPDVDCYRRMEDAGVTSLICAPWMLAPGAMDAARAWSSAADYQGSLAAKRAAIEDFAEVVIAKMA